MQEVSPREKFNLNLSANGIQAIGTVDFDDMDNAIVSIKVDGKVLSETQISVKEFEVLRSYFKLMTA